MNNQGLEASFTGAFPAETPLAMAYVPVQKIHYVYDPDNALMQGTLFPELDKPFLGGNSRNNEMSDPNASARMQNNYSNKSDPNILSGVVKPSTGNTMYERGLDK